MEPDRHLGWLVLSWRHTIGDDVSGQVAAWHTGWVPTYDECADTEGRARLARGTLTSLIDLVRLPSPPSSRRPATVGEAFGELLEVALEGRASAAQWWDIGASIRDDPARAPQGEALEALLFRLANALPRGVKHAFRMMRSAALDIAEVPALQGPMVRAIRDCLGDPEGPSFVETIGLLEQIPTAESRGVLLELLETTRSRSQRQYAAELAAETLARGEFTEAERSRVVLGVLKSWRSDPVVAHEDLGQLIGVLPAGLAEVLARDGRVSAAEVADPMAAISVPEASRWSHDLAQRSLADWPAGGEPVVARLESLVHQCLFVSNPELRWRATLLLSASPFQPGLAHALIGLLRQPGVPVGLRRRGAKALSHVVSEGSTLQLIPLLHDPDPAVAERATMAYGHTTYSGTADQILRRGGIPPEQQPISRARVYALGMTGSPGIAVLAESTTAPRWQRQNARWWHEHGPAIHA
ncbi:hypothetical protein ncot_02090 [Nocardioides sp. JQ2195]|uniref:hypothetical protein n=1 Tax=Nocardioides sp. JQ2195 TaxID=2592334 RepID=UPI00143E7022|nr:hypothetical protein [Nocardioides sp. JQ2195]QIX25512.1 hypothetical protein ncot_02090 [Nocardioides sp. JQ2195]